MKTAMTGDDADGHIIYNAPDLVWPALRLRCKSLPAISDQDQGQSGAADQLICRDIFLPRTFRNLDDLNAQLEAGSLQLPIASLHGTTQRMVSEAFAAEQPDLQPLAPSPFDELLRLERRVSLDGLVSIGGRAPSPSREVVMTRARRSHHHRHHQEQPGGAEDTATLEVARCHPPTHGEPACQERSSSRG